MKMHYLMMILFRCNGSNGIWREDDFVIFKVWILDVKKMYEQDKSAPLVCSTGH